MACVANLTAQPTILRSTVWGTPSCSTARISRRPHMEIRKLSVVSENRDKEESGFGSGDLARSTLALLAVGAILLMPSEAWAAKSGGRVGGSSFRSSPAPQQRQQQSVPSRSYNTSRTNIYVAPSVAPPVYGGYGYGGTPFFGGWSPFYSYGPTVAVGGGGGFISFLFFVAIAGLLVNVARTIFNSRDED